MYTRFFAFAQQLVFTPKNTALHSRPNFPDDLTGKYYPSQFIDYKADVEKPLPMIF